MTLSPVHWKRHKRATFNRCAAIDKLVDLGTRMFLICCVLGSFIYFFSSMNEWNCNTERVSVYRANVYEGGDSKWGSRD